MYPLSLSHAKNIFAKYFIPRLDSIAHIQKHPHLRLNPGLYLLGLNVFAFSIKWLLVLQSYVR